MKKDLSKLLYDKYFSLKNRNINLLLKNGRSLNGYFEGFYKGDEDDGDPYILKWHFISGRYSSQLSNDEGEIIRQKDIQQIIFEEDNTEIKF